MPRWWSSLHAAEWIIGEPSLRLAPTHEALQRGIATIAGAGGKVLLCSDEGSGHRRCQCRDRLSAELSDQRRVIHWIANHDCPNA